MRKRRAPWTRALEEKMSEQTVTPPDRLSVDPDSPFHDEAVLARGVGVRFKGVEKTNVEEYCVSEGWVRLSVGNTVDRRGRPMAVKLKGAVEPYFQNSAQDSAQDSAEA
ncbi:hypothetical protein GCM10019059_32910 [Camelimonas fluminis]|nr:hypothetical protein GCM10019059_32910 [Camelimonas fluminis]